MPRVARNGCDGGSAVFSGASVFRRTPQSIPNTVGGIGYQIHFEEVSYDSASYADLVGNDKGLVCPSDGIYLVTFAAFWDPSGTGARRVSFSFGSQNVHIDNRPAVGGGWTNEISTAVQLHLDNTSTIFPVVYQTSGAALSIQVGALDPPAGTLGVCARFSVVRLGDTP